jgi:amino-acid N-acetyltransferase
MTETTVSRYQLRAARLDDLPAIERLLTQVSLPVDGVSESLDTFVVALADDRVIGVAGIERCGEYGLLRSVATDPDWRDAGVGSAVVDRAIASAEARGMESLYLLTTTAERYFPRFGFEKIERDEAPEPIRNNSQFTDLCPSSATLMHRPFSAR